jgi:hypothetical protein
MTYKTPHRKKIKKWFVFPNKKITFAAAKFEGEFFIVF